jgi:hypothetical protein
LLCASPVPVVVRFCPSAEAKTCIMMMIPIMPMTIATITSTSVKPLGLAIAGGFECEFMAV